MAAAATSIANVESTSTAITAASTCTTAISNASGNGSHQSAAVTIIVSPSDASVLKPSTVAVSHIHKGQLPPPSVSLPTQRSARLKVTGIPSPTLSSAAKGSTKTNTITGVDTDADVYPPSHSQPSSPSSKASKTVTSGIAIIPGAGPDADADMHVASSSSSASTSTSTDASTSLSSSISMTSTTTSTPSSVSSPASSLAFHSHHMTHPHAHTRPHLPTPQPKLCVRFAPLPITEPRTHKRPLGVAARAALLRQRPGRAGYNYNNHTYYGQQHDVDSHGNGSGEKEKEWGGKRRSTPPGAGAGASTGMNGEGGRTMLDEQDDAFVALGKMLNDAGKNLWKKISAKQKRKGKEAGTDDGSGSAVCVKGDKASSSPSSSLRKKVIVNEGRKVKRVIADELAVVEELDVSNGQWKNDEYYEDGDEDNKEDAKRENGDISNGVRRGDTHDLTDKTHILEEDGEEEGEENREYTLESVHGEIQTTTTVEVRVVAVTDPEGKGDDTP